MINGLVRFWWPEGPAKPDRPGSSSVTDFDQRRTISVTRCDEYDGPDEFIVTSFCKSEANASHNAEGHSPIVKHPCLRESRLMHEAELLLRYIDSLGPQVHKLEAISETGELNSVSSNADEDETICVHYPPLQELEKPARVGIVARSELEELERLVPMVDIVAYDADSSSRNGDKREMREAVFKYCFHVQYLHQRWDELNIWMRLPPHPNIVPFDRLVVEELHGQQRVVGFTSLYINGGTLFQRFRDAPFPQNNKTPRKGLFKLKWLLQLTSLVNDLNLSFGIEHQDIQEIS